MKEIVKKYLLAQGVDSVEDLSDKQVLNFFLDKSKICVDNALIHFDKKDVNV